MNKFKGVLTFLVFVFTISVGQAYVLNQTKTGIPIHWASGSPVVDIYVNSQNIQGLNEIDVQRIANDSIVEWNGNASITLRKNQTVNSDQPDLNELYFSSDPTIFNGSGVLGVTQVAFKESSGEIVSADVVISDTYTFSTSSTDEDFLGNVFTHEVGHFLGLGHGQVQGSTMFYALTRGEHKLDDDDKAGIYAIYPSGGKGTLTGTIVGGKKLATVFGTHVQAISVSTGKVMASSISDVSGNFKIAGLPLMDQYLIYTSPIKQIGLPGNYANVRNDFCDSGKKYRGSFFQACGGSSEGFPQSIKLINSSQDVGNVTIRCNLDSPPEYMANKSITPAVFDLNAYSPSGVGGSFVGFFSAAEIATVGIKDYFKLDLSNVNWNSISADPNLYLEIKVTNQAFYSPFKANISITRRTGTTNVVPNYAVATDGWINIDTVKRIPINRADSSDNDFQIQVTPEAMTGGSAATGIPYLKSDLFPDYSNFQDDIYFYLVTTSIVRDNFDGTFTQVSSRVDTLSDNTRCPDAMNTYSLTNYSATGIEGTSQKRKAAGCGTVDFDQTPGSGPGGFMVGLILSFVLYAITRYSKMA